MDKTLRAARSSGTLNLSNRNLTDVPTQVFSLQESLGTDEKWWEVVDLQKLILSHNKLSTLSESLSQLVALTLLDVSHNQLTSLPEGLAKLEALKSLDVSANALTALPAAIGGLLSLVRLICSQNALSALPSELGNCQGLTEVKAANNRITFIPASLGTCSRLTTLDLEANQLTSLPEQVLNGLTALTELNLSKNELQSMPESVGRLSSLVRLDLRQNKLTALPKGLSSCKALAEFYVGFNNLLELPGELAGLRSLGTLDLRDNKLTELPAEVCDLRLQLLDLSNNDLSGLPPQLGTMTTLRRLVLDGNPLRTLRSALVTGPTTALLKFLRSRMEESKEEQLQGKQTARSGNIFATGVNEQVASASRSAATSGALSVAGMGLSEVPAAAWEAGQLVSLDLSKNCIAQLPGELGMCTSLEVLRLADNKVQEWPGGVLASLPALHELVLARNPLNQLPKGAFSAVSKLRVLDLTGVVRALSPSVALSDMPHLEELRLGLMQLQEVPYDICSLSSLRILDLHQNAITSVPEDIAALTKLEELDISNNDVSNLPPRLGLLEPTLRSLKVEGNPMRSIRRPILERGTKAVLQYLKDRMPA